VKESGVNKPKFEYLNSTGDQNAREAQLVQAMLTAVGFDVTLRTVEFGTFLEEAKKGNFNMARVGWTVAPEPNEMLYSRYHTGTPESFNWSRFSNAQVDALLDQGIKEQDQAKRAVIYQQAQRLIVDEAPEFHIFHETRVYGVNKRVDGFKGHFGGAIYLKAPTLNIDVTLK
jgi:peptide/nickel transport system substrate-binding protein